MQNPIRILGRKLALRRHKSKLPHSIVPLSIITHATVLVDPDKEDVAITCGAVKQYFGYKNIDLTLYCPTEKELDFLGCIKKKCRKPAPEGAVELFICLIDDSESFLAEYESRCSKAAFKVGRFDYEEGLYDLTLLGPDGAAVTQSAVFASAKNYLDIIK